MKKILINRWTIFAISVLILNAVGLCWIRSSFLAAIRLKEADSVGVIGGADGPTAIFVTNKEPKKVVAEQSVSEKAVEVAEDLGERDPSKTAAQLSSCTQIDFSTDRRLTLALIFNKTIDWRQFEKWFSIQCDNQKIPWQFTKPPFENRAFLQTQGALPKNRLTIWLTKPENPADPLVIWDKDYQVTIDIEDALALKDVSTESKSRGQPCLQLQFSQSVDLDSLRKSLSVEPSVGNNFTFQPGYGGYVSVYGDFQPEKTYRVSLLPTLLAKSGHKLHLPVWRQVKFPKRNALLEVPFQGRYLTPHGKLTVPISCVNITGLTCTVSRVYSQNIVQLAMRENNEYNSWNCWGATAAENAESLTEKLSTKEIQISLVPNTEKIVLVHLSEMLPEKPRGVYLMELEAKGNSYQKQTSQLITISDLALSYRESEHEVVAWTARLSTGAKVPHCKVTLYSATNAKLSSALTDDQGIARLPFRSIGKDRPFVVVAEDSATGDITFVSRSNANVTDAPFFTPYADVKTPEAFLMTDRDLYRPGETVFIQGLLRTWEGKAPRAFPLQIDLLKPNGQLLKSYSVLPDALGSVTQNVEMAEALPSGRYRYSLRMPGKDGATLSTGSYVVDSFVPPQTRLKFIGLPETLSAKAQKKVPVTLQAEHLFGGASKDMSTDLKVIYKSMAFAPKEWGAYRFGDAEKKKIFETEGYGTEITSVAGEAKYEVQLPVSLNPAGQIAAVFQGKATETSGRTVSANQMVPFHVYPFYVGLKIPNSNLHAGGTVRVDVAAVGADEKRLDHPVRLSAKLESVSYASSIRWEENDSSYHWVCDETKKQVTSASFKTEQNEDASIALSIPHDGEYVMTVFDPDSNSSTSFRFSTGWNGGDGIAPATNPEEVRISFDKDSYEPGDVAKIRLQAPFSGTAWVTMQREQILENWVVPLTNRTAELSVKVCDAFAPNVEIAVTAIRPTTSEKVWRTHRATGIEPLKVVPPNRILKVDVKPPQEVLLPGREIPMEITVKQSDGKAPQKAEVTVLAVDEALCMLTGYQTPDPNQAFFKRRTANLHLYDVYRKLLPVYNEALVANLSHTGGDDGSDLLSRLNPVAARRFRPLSLWKGNVALDANGKAAVPFRLPEFSGELRLMAVAWSDRAIGSADYSVKVHRPVVVQPDLPRILAPKDQTFMTVALHNKSGAAKNVELDLTATGPVSLPAPKTTIALAKDDSKVISIPVVAKNEVGAAKITIRVLGCGEEFSDSIEIPVRPISGWYSGCRPVVIPAGETRKVETPTNALPSTFSQEIYAFTPGAVDLQGAMNYLISYPYSCMEQTVSTILPFMMLDQRQKNEWFKGTSFASEIDRKIDEAAAHIALMFQWDGFAPWTGMDDAHIDTTLYGALFTVLAKKQGKEFDFLPVKDVLDSLRESSLGALCSWGEYETSLLRDAYASHILALAGKPDYNRMGKLSERTEFLDDEALFHLARAWILSGNVKEGRRILKTVTHISTLKSAAFGLLTWLELDPASPMVEICREKIEDERDREEGHWCTTQRNAFAILALSAYERRFSHRNSAPGQIAIAWQGDSVSATVSNRWHWIPPKTAKAAALEIRNEGKSDLVVTRKTSFVPQAGTLPAVDQGMEIRRTYHSVTEGTSIDLGSLKRGDQVVVCLTYKPLRKDHDIVIEDVLPACLEIEQANIAKAKTLKWIPDDTTDWILHREARDDRLLLFTGLVSEKKTYHYYYVARVVTAGEFQVPAVNASDMYNPDRFSRTAPTRVKIIDPNQK